MDVYARLGVRPIINARGMNTMASGSLMPKPVLDAMTEAAGAFVDMAELNARAGAHIARLVGVDGAHVTSGSAGGLLLAAAACIAGDDPDRVRRLPDTAGMRNEIVIQRCDRIHYDQALRQAGAVVVEVGTADACTPDAIEAAIGERTAALIYIVSPRARRPRRGARADGRHRPRPRAAADRGRGVDPAAGRPPHALDEDGRGPRDREAGARGSAGRRTRASWSAARTSSAPPRPTARPIPPSGGPARSARRRSSAWSTALELFLQDDHDAEWARHLDEARRILGAVTGIPGVARAPGGGPHACTPPPRCCSASTAAATGLTPDDVMHALRRGEPPIMVRVSRGELLVDPHCLRGDEATVVARRLREELLRRPARA